MFALMPLLSASFQSPIASILLRLHPDSMKQSLPNCQSFRACLSGWNSHFSACVFMGLCEEWNLNVNSVLMGIRHTLKIVSKNVAWKWFQMSLSYFKLASIGNALCVNRTINCVTRVIKAEREREEEWETVSLSILKRSHRYGAHLSGGFKSCPTWRVTFALAAEINSEKWTHQLQVNWFANCFAELAVAITRRATTAATRIHSVEKLSRK